MVGALVEAARVGCWDNVIWPLHPLESAIAARLTAARLDKVFKRMLYSKTTLSQDAVSNASALLRGGRRE
jgi:hypothetical protein